MKWHFFLVTCFFGISTLATSWADDSADLDFSDFSQEQITAPAKQTPFSFNTYVDVIGPAKINKGFFKGDDLHFAEAEAELGFVFYYCKAYTEGANLALSYTATYIRWEQNPCFEQDHFNTVSFSLAGFTKRVRDWFWRGQLTVNFDTGSEWTGEYFNYDVLLWGRYTYCEHIGLHLGLIGQTGMGMDRVYPILGADWQMSKNWKLNLVYPVNVSLEYSLSKAWSLALAGRNFSSRHRVKRDEACGKATVRYENIGAEFAIKYDACGMTANLHAGTTLGGTYRMANRHNHHPRHYHLDPSPYAGAEVELKF